MARITSILECLHTVAVQVPEHQYHNISRLMQPQIRSVCDSFKAAAGSEEQPMSSAMKRRTPATTAAAEARNLQNGNGNGNGSARKPAAIVVSSGVEKKSG